jgi:hypothetical protein
MLRVVQYCAFSQEKSAIFQFKSRAQVDKKLAEIRDIGYRGGTCAERVIFFSLKLGEVVGRWDGSGRRALELE